MEKKPTLNCWHAVAGGACYRVIFRELYRRSGSSTSTSTYSVTESGRKRKASFSRSSSMPCSQLDIVVKYS